jgi:hypothetical protein
MPPFLFRGFGWVERPHPLKLNEQSTSETHQAHVNESDGFREGLNPSYELACVVKLD